MKHAGTYLGQFRRKSMKAGPWMHGTRSCINEVIERKV